VTKALEKDFSSREPIRRAKGRSPGHVDISSKAIRNERDQGSLERVGR
jgi:hypothetical protein